MRPIVGFLGGSSLHELGPAADVQLFFDCIEVFAVPAVDEDWEVITDRLYRRYLRIEDQGPAQHLMRSAFGIFSETPTASADLSHAKLKRGETRLRLEAPFLDGLFEGYEAAFLHCKSSAELFLESWSRQQPLRIVVADMPKFISEKGRALLEYDSLAGKPFWAQ